MYGLTPFDPFSVTYDANGNISEYIDLADGSITAHHEYDAFGQQTVSTGTAPCTFGFSTKYLDAETDLLYYGFRYYDAEIGRWLNRDRVGERAGLNLHHFVYNNPVLYVDKLGLTCDRRVVLAHLLSGPNSAQDDYEENLEKATNENPNDDPVPTIYCTCGGNQLNEDANNNGFGVPGAPQNTSAIPLSSPDYDTAVEEGLDLDNDFLFSDEWQSRMDDAIAVARADICADTSCSTGSIEIDCSDIGNADNPLPSQCSQSPIAVTCTCSDPSP